MAVFQSNFKHNRHGNLCFDITHGAPYIFIFCFDSVQNSWRSKSSDWMFWMCEGTTRAAPDREVMYAALWHQGLSGQEGFEKKTSAKLLKTVNTRVCCAVKGGGACRWKEKMFCYFLLSVAAADVKRHSTDQRGSTSLGVLTEKQRVVHSCNLLVWTGVHGCVISLSRKQCKSDRGLP